VAVEGAAAKPFLFLAQPRPHWLQRLAPPQDLQWAEFICMTKLARVSKCCGEDKCNITQNKQPGGRLPPTVREQAALPLAASANLSSAGVGGAPGRCHGRGRGGRETVRFGRWPPAQGCGVGGGLLLPVSSHYWMVVQKVPALSSPESDEIILKLFKIITLRA